MKSKILHEAGDEQTFALIFDQGDEVMSQLQKFAQEHHLTAAHFTAIGALSDVVFAWFDWQTKKYNNIPVREQVEVLTLSGDISESDGEPKIHAHLIVGKSDGTAHGGHLVEAHVRPTLELILTQTPVHLQRKVDPRSGVALIQM
jgi:predicted DNA-binding protein with PD1-like motif